ncbi:EamA family transporter [Candidatus Woesearchaeota archaeon]|nr:EamA family transporter [Candidatus Woesearchaeota archaeon]
MLNLFAAFLVLIATFTGAFSSLFLKKGAEKFNLSLLQQLRNKDLILGVVLFFAGFVVYVYALSLEKLSILYPITALTYVWTAFISIKFLNEKMNLYKWLGIATIILGIFCVTYFAG